MSSRAKMVTTERFFVHSTTFPNKDVDTIMNVHPFTYDTYIIRHIITQGSFRIDFPGTSRPSESVFVGDSWPKNDSYDITSFNLVPLEDNSQFYCITNKLRIPGSVDVIEKISTLAGQELQIPKNSVVFVFGSDYTINGKLYLGNTVVASDSGDYLLTTTSPIITTMVVPKTIQYILVDTGPL